jgi:hypothetical protein
MPLMTSAMIWFDARTVVPATTPIVPLPSVRTGWSTPGTTIFRVQFSRSTQFWNSPGLSPRSAPTSNVTIDGHLYRNRVREGARRKKRKQEER